MSTIRPIACALLLSSASCQSAPPAADTSPTESAARMPGNAGVRLTLDRSSYRPGADVTITLTNSTSQTFGYNECTRMVERQDGNSWTAVAEPDRVCTMHLALLQPNSTASARTDLPASLRSGSYRLSLALSDETANAAGPRVYSSVFTVN